MGRKSRPEIPFRPRLQPLLLRSASVIREVTATPDAPGHAAILYEEDAPRFFDLSTATLAGGVVADAGVSTARPLEIAAGELIRPLFHSPARAVAFRPARAGAPAEAAVAFGEGDDCIYRFLLNSRERLPSLWMDEPVRLAYSPDGRYLACGGARGALSVFDLFQDAEPKAVVNDSVPGEILALTIDNGNDWLYVLTELNLALRTSLRQTEQCTRIHLSDRRGNRIAGSKLYAAACSPQGSLLALAGASNEFWLADWQTTRGRILRSITGAPIRYAQFNSRQELLLCGDAGVELWWFSANYSSSVWSAVPLVAVLHDESPGKILAARYYGDTLYTFCLKS